MDAGKTLADAALETLPITVAVLDGEGEILSTNDPWRAFGPDDHRTDRVGVNYIETAGTDTDTDATSDARSRASRRSPTAGGRRSRWSTPVTPPSESSGS